MTEAAQHPGMATPDGAAQTALPPFPTAGGEESLSEMVTALPVDHFGTTVFVKCWQYPASEHPPIVIVHDVGEHADCYLAAAKAFVYAGYSVYLYDWRGHGRSGRQLGHAPSFQVLVKDLLQVAAWARSQDHGRAPIIIGQGLGALVVMEFMKHHGHFCSAAVLSAPCMELVAEVSGVRRFVLKLLADFMPMLRIRAPLAPRFTKERVSLHPTGYGEAVVLSTKFPGITAMLTHELAAAVKRSEARFIEFAGSVLILCPEKDNVCTYQALKKSAAIHADHNLQIADLPQTSHNVFTSDEAGREGAVNVILTWLTKSAATADGVGAGAQSAARSLSEGEVKPGATKS